MEMQMDSEHCERDATVQVYVSVEKKDKDNKVAQEKAIALGKEKIKDVVKLELQDKIRWQIDDEFGWMCPAGLPTCFGIYMWGIIKR